MNEARARGVLVVGHGSRRAEANEDVLNAARLIGGRGGFDLIEAAFLEIARPTIEESFTRLVERGARAITVHPYFLSPGRHTRGDIPVEVRRAAGHHPGVAYRISEPLAAHRFVIDASVERIRDCESELPMSRASNSSLRGTVFLVGAGPGDPALLTIKARDLLAACDTVVYDYLVNPEILQFAPRDSEKIYVGKVGGGHQTSQIEINRLLVERARKSEIVVRLKGGDPFLFGRGGEEALALREAGIRFEIVPGISSALGVPAYAGIPVTHREVSSSFAVVTGTRIDDESNTNQITSLAHADTLVVLMGVSRLREISRRLIDAGRSPNTPVAVIRWGTYEGQQTVVGTLTSIADEAERARIRAPAVIVVGEVVRLRERLNWFETNIAGTEDEVDVGALIEV
jgi:uroporphyrin-III C-methyltransferase